MYTPIDYKLGLSRQKKKVRHNFCFQRVLVPWGEAGQMVFVLRIAEFEGLELFICLSGFVENHNVIGEQILFLETTF